MISQIQRFSILFFLVTMLTSICSPIHAAWQQPPHQFPPSGSSGALSIASDANGHAFATPNRVFSDIGEYASFFSLGVWQDPPELIGPGTVSSSDLAMDNTGTAIAIWYDIAGQIRSSYFNGLVWSTPPPNPLDMVTNFNAVPVAVAMNGPISGVAIWTDNGTTDVRNAFFFGGAWSIPTTIGTGNFNPSVGYSTNGTAVAGWFDVAGGTTVNNFTGGIWQGPIVLDPTGTSEAVVGIDSTGKALAVWRNAVGIIAYSTFNGVSWSPIFPITGTLGNSNVSLGVAPGGTAVATWRDDTGQGVSSSYNGIVWSAPILITSDSISANLALSVADNGNALAVWGTDTQISSSRLPFGGTAWTPAELVTTFDFPVDLRLIEASLSENGTGFASWIIASEGSDQFASATVPPTGPLNLQGFCCRNKFAMQTECADTITWSPSIDPSVTAYYVRKNGVLVAIIPQQGPYTFVDLVGCRDSTTYTVTAVDFNGVESLASTIILSCR